MEEKFIKAIKSNVKLLMSMPWESTINGSAWEFMVADAHGLPHVRRQLLYDVVDSTKSIGWSVKTMTISKGKVESGTPVNPVIARADIFKKCYPDLGYFELSLKSSPQEIGNAIIRFWNQKVKDHAKILEIETKKISILAKSKDLTSFAYFEKDIDKYDENSFEWDWSKDKTGLYGKYKEKDYWKFKWSPAEHQLFEKWLIPKDALFFNLEIHHFTVESLKDVLNIHA